MNREKKFRVWDKQDKRMIVHKQKFYPLKVCSLGVLRLSATHEEDLYSIINPDRFEIMQYTGLKDKNGKEIYEGHIVKEFLGTNYLVIYQAPSFVVKRNKRSKTWLTFDVHPDDNQSYEIVGNIFENPELLNNPEKGKIEKGWEE